MRKLELGSLGCAVGAWCMGAVAIAACGPLVPPIDEGDTTSTTSTTSSSSTMATSEDDGFSFDDAFDWDTEGTPFCQTNGTCDQIDLVIVVDNSSTMGEEQLNLSRNFPLLIDALMELTDADGQPVSPSINIMVTTTDFGHPLCTAFEKPDYEPRQGAPVYTGCNSRIERFTSTDPLYPLVIEEACTSVCPVDVEPS